jgi:site-specific recombinase XerC
VEKAGLKDYTWHCNRHSVASRLVMAGVDIRTVAQLLVHATIQVNRLAPKHNQMAHLGEMAIMNAGRDAKGYVRPIPYHFDPA